MKETIVRCDVCKQVISPETTDDGEYLQTPVRLELSSEPSFLERYYSLVYNNDNMEVVQRIDWPDVCPTCRRHLARKLAEAINEIWKEG